MKHYLFGYGSLINRESRLKSAPNALDAIPVRVSGLRRGWFARTGVFGPSTTYLGCIQSMSSTTNGVIFEVHNDELVSLDDREKGYERVEIMSSQITPLYPWENGGAKIWVYLNLFDAFPLEDHIPSEQFPICQSYVDLIVSGCLNIETEYNINFAEELLESTSHWSEFWINDRLNPRRPSAHTPLAHKIDTLLRLKIGEKASHGIFNIPK